MIAGVLHKGSGLGDQLFRYVTVRSLALDKGLSWSMFNPGNFKGASFMDIDFGEARFVTEPARFMEREIRENGIDVRSYDPEINFVQDNTVIDGCFEDSKYWMHNLDEFRNWLPTEPIGVPDDLCIIGFRGGEYATVPDLFLTKDYWEAAMAQMRKINPEMKFRIVTDDPDTARACLPHVPVTHEIGNDWRLIRSAPYSIIANSAFYILPRLMHHAEADFTDNDAVTIAPRYWARRNLGVWARPACYYKSFTYI